MASPRAGLTAPPLPDPSPTRNRSNGTVESRPVDPFWEPGSARFSPRTQVVLVAARSEIIALGGLPLDSSDWARTLTDGVRLTPIAWADSSQVPAITSMESAVPTGRYIANDRGTDTWEPADEFTAHRRIIGEAPRGLILLDAGGQLWEADAATGEFSTLNIDRYFG